MLRRQEFKFLWTSEAPYKAVVAARGSGKTIASLQYVVEKLITGEENGSSIFFSSTLKQVKRTIEGPMRAICREMPEEFVQYNKTDLTYNFKFSKNDIRSLYMLSYNDAKELRGYHPQTIVLDECASMPADMYGYVILPMLTDEESKLITIGTPNGHTKFYEFYRQGLDERYPEWESYAIKASEHPNIFPPARMEIRRKNMSIAAYNQEYECDWEANVLVGSVYGEYLNRFTKSKIGEYEWDASRPVYTAWDIGWTAYTAIWFYQIKEGVVTFIDYYENNRKEVPYYADVLNKRPYMIKMNFLPHDGSAGNVRGSPVIEQLKEFGFKGMILPKEGHYKENGIERCRVLLQTCRFNKDKCELGLQRLYNYKYKMNWKTGEPTGQTEDDENEHGADAFRYAAQSLKYIKGAQEIKYIKDYGVLNR